MRELWAVVVNEWVKLLHRRRFLIATVLSLLVLGIYGISEYHAHQNFMRYSNFAQNGQMQIQSLQQQIKQESQSNQSNKQAMIASLRQQVSQIEESIKQNNEIQGPNWRIAVQQQIQMHKQSISSIQNNSTASAMQNANNQFQTSTEQATIRQLQYNLAHNVKPLPNGAHNPYMETTHFFSIAAMIFFPMIMVIMVSDMISGESTSGTIKLLLVRPVSRTKILLGKWIVSAISAIIWTVLLCVLIQVISMAVWGTEGSAQPVLTGVYYTFERVVDTSNPMNGSVSQVIPIAHYAHSTILPEWQFFLDTTLLMVLAMMVVTTITFFFSTLFKSAMASTATAMGIVVIGFVITKMASHSSFLRWVFSTNLDLAQNWNGQLSMQMNQPITLHMGVVVLCVWGIVSLIASMIVFSKRDILNA